MISQISWNTKIWVAASFLSIVYHSPCRNHDLGDDFDFLTDTSFLGKTWSFSFPAPSNPQKQTLRATCASLCMWLLRPHTEHHRGPFTWPMVWTAALPPTELSWRFPRKKRPPGNREEARLIWASEVLVSSVSRGKKRGIFLFQNLPLWFAKGLNPFLLNPSGDCHGLQ